MRIRLLASLFVLSACAPGGEVRVDLAGLRSSAALTGVPLDRITVRASAPDFGEVSAEIRADQETVSLEVPPGPERLFELEAIRVAEDGTEVVAFAGETVQTVTVGVNEVLLRYRAQGLVRIEPAIVGDDSLPAGAFLVLVDEQSRTTKVEFNAPTTIRAGSYTVAGSGLGALRAPGATTIDVAVGEANVVSLPLFRSSTQCLPDSPPEVRNDGQGCATVELSVTGLALPEVEILINGVPLLINSDGSFLAQNGVPVGEPFNVTVQAPGGNPKQECEIINGTGVGGTSDPVSINCGPVLYRLDLQAFGEVGEGVVVAVRQSESEPPAMVPLPDTELVETSLFLPTSGSPGSVDVFIDEQPTDPAIRCRVADEFEVVGTVVPPLRVVCVRAPALIYAGRDSVGDFIADDGPDRFSASNTPCVTGELGFDRCFDASAARTLTVPGFTRCDEVTVEDFGTLIWTCDDRSGEVVLRSTGYLSLVGAIDPFIPSASIRMRVVKTGGSPRTVAEPPSAPIGNPLVDASAALSLGQPLDQPGTLYYYAGSPVNPGTVILAGDRITFVASFTLSTGSVPTVTIDDGDFNTVSGVVVNTFTSGGNAIDTTSTAQFATILGEYRTSDAFGTCINVNAPMSVVRARATGCGTGINIGAQYVTVERSVVTEVGLDGINLSVPHQRVFDTVVDRVGSLSSGSGIFFSDETGGDIWIDRVRVSEAGGSGITVSNGQGVHISNTLIVGSEFDALDVGTRHNLIRRVTVANGNSNGLDLSFADATRIEGALSAGFFTNLGIGESSDVSVRDAVLADSLGSRVSSLNSNNVEFEGQLVFESGSCSEFNGANVGFAEPDCVDGTGALPAPSTADATELSTGLEGTFVGPVSDIENFTSGAFSGELVPPVSITDWSRFESRSRAWREASGFGTSRCSSSCAVFDFTPNASSPAVGLAPPPDSLPTHRVVWGSAMSADECPILFTRSVFDAGPSECFNEYLVSADEVSGNGNGLCESDETCVYRPDAGAFSAGGPPFTPQTVSSGNVTNVTLLVPTVP